MADSFIQYTASGSTDTFNIPFGYLDPDHISVTVDGTTEAFTFPSASQVQITSGNPTGGATVEVRRTTPRDTRQVVWSNAANLTATDLNTSDLQLLYIAQEAFDTAASTIGLANDGTFDANNVRIKNVATPTQSTDAATKAYVDASTVDIVSDAQAAQTGAETAQTAAEAAQAAAEAALAQAQTIYDNFDDRYLGQKSSAPALDNDGDALIDGALYYNTTDNSMYVYDLGTTTWLIIDAAVGAGTITATELADEAVTNTKLAHMSQATIKGRQSGAGTGDAEDLTASQARTILDVYTQAEVDAAVAAAGTDWTDVAAVDLTSGGPNTVVNVLSSLPAGTTEIELFLDGVSLNGNEYMRIQLEDSGGFETSGYDGHCHQMGTGIAPLWISTGFPIYTSAGGGVHSIYGIIRLKHIGGNRWLLEYSGTYGTSNASQHKGFGRVDLDGDITGARINSSGSDSFDSGSISARYK